MAEGGVGPVVDVHRHVIVEAITRARGHPRESWRPRVTWAGQTQVVEMEGREIRSAIQEFVHVDRILEAQSTVGVDHVVLSPWVALLTHGDPEREARASRIQNESLAELCREHPGRVSALGAVPLLDPRRAVGELERVRGDLGLLGVEVPASVGGAYLGDDRFGPFWEAAEDLGAAVFVHPTTRGFDLPVFQDYYLWNTVANPMETTVTGAHLVMAGVLQAHPALKIVLAHGGGAILALRGRLRHAHSFQPQARSRLTEAPDGSMRRLYYDTVAHDLDVLRDLVGYVGAEHVLLGSDHPFDMGVARPGEPVRSLGLSADDEAAILGENAVRLFDLKL